jgi:hypothetical protein
MISSAYSITDTAQKVVEAEPLVRTIYLNVVGNTTVFLGGSGVISTNGCPVAKNSVPLAVVVPYGEEVYAVCASGNTESLHILRPND